MNNTIATRIRNLFCRGTIIFTNAGANLQRFQARLFGKEVGNGIEYMEHYGLTTHPPAGCDAAILFVGGSRDHGVCVAVGDRKFRIKGLQCGEVALYTDEGDYFILKRDNITELKTKKYIVNAEESVEINTQSYTVNAGVKTEFVTPSWSLKNNNTGSRAKAVMAADIEQDGYHKSTGDQVAGNVSKVNHPHKVVLSGNDTTGKPVGGAL